MCFIKTIYQPVQSKKIVFDPFLNSKEACFDNFLKKKNFPKDRENFKNPHFTSLKDDQIKLLTFLSNYMTLNQNSINSISKKISSCEEKLNELLIEFPETINNEIKNEKSSETSHFHHDFALNEIETLQNKEQFSQNALTNKLFGEKKYKYKLSLAQNDFQNVIYKERNLKLNLALKDLDGKIVKNCNIMNLCLTFADDNGKWITQNRVGDPMLKGKTEVELYHGEAEFNKIYAKDISRTFTNGRLNFVVYAKPSMLIYNGVANGIEERVQVSAIEPLVLEGIIIKAKKKY